MGGVPLDGIPLNFSSQTSLHSPFSDSSQLLFKYSCPFLILEAAALGGLICNSLCSLASPDFRRTVALIGPKKVTAFNIVSLSLVRIGRMNSRHSTCQS